jgi:hypothetical protein
MSGIRHVVEDGNFVIEVEYEPVLGEPKSNEGRVPCAYIAHESVS